MLLLGRSNRTVASHILLIQQGIRGLRHAKPPYRNGGSRLNSAPPASAPPSKSPPASAPPSKSPPASAPPAKSPPASAPPAKSPPASAPPSKSPPAAAPRAAAPRVAAPRVAAPRASAPRVAAPLLIGAAVQPAARPPLAPAAPLPAGTFFAAPSTATSQQSSPASPVGQGLRAGQIQSAQHLPQVRQVPVGAVHAVDGSTSPDTRPADRLPGAPWRS
jgi:hypothetical protein